MCLVLHSTRRHHASSRCPQRCWLFACSADACTLTIHVCFPPLQAEGAFADAHCVRDRAPLGSARPHVPPTTLTHQCAKPTARWSVHSRALSACMTVHDDTSDHLCALLTGTGGGCCRGVLRRPARCVRRRGLTVIGEHADNTTQVTDCRVADHTTQGTHCRVAGHTAQVTHCRVAGNTTQGTHCRVAGSTACFVAGRNAEIDGSSVVVVELRDCATQRFDRSLTVRAKERFVFSTRPQTSVRTRTSHRHHTDYTTTQRVNNTPTKSKTSRWFESRENRHGDHQAQSLHRRPRRFRRHKRRAHGRQRGHGFREGYHRCLQYACGARTWTNAGLAHDART